MRRTIEGWMADAAQVLAVWSFERDLEEVAEQAMSALKQVLEIHHRVESRDGTYCASCPDRWPCDTVRRIAKALDVRA